MGTGGKCDSEHIQAVLTCQGDIDDPDFPTRCQTIFDKLAKVLDNQELDVTKCEPWNSVKVTFNIPVEAAEKLARLAEAGDQVLRDLGILSIQVEGGQVISMTMIEEDSDSEAESSTSTPNSSPVKPTPVLPIEEKVKVKEEPLLAAPDQPSLKSSAASRNQFSAALLSSTPPRPGTSRLPSTPPPAAMLIKTLPLSSGASGKSSESSLPGLSNSPQLLGGKEGRFSALLSSRTLNFGKSELLKDSEEPAPKKARKQETIRSSDNNSLGSAGFPYSSLGGSGSGFTILPVSSMSSRSLPSGSQISSQDSASLSPVSGSSVNLANLPGVSLTSVNPRSNQQFNSLSSRKGTLMPPPSSVTLSPVPRTNNVNSSNDRTTQVLSDGLSETGDKKPTIITPVTLESAKLSLHSSKVGNKQTLLINPVTGQFEVGPVEPLSDSSDSKRDQGAAAKPSPDPSCISEGSDKSKQKIDSPSCSPGGSSTSGEHSLKLKLKVPNNSSKGSKDGLIQSKLQNKVTETLEPKLPKLKIKLKENSVELENEQNLESSALNFSEPGELPQAHLQLDLKTRVRIKPLPEKVRILEGGKADGSFPNLNQINHISIDTTPDKKKKMSTKGKKGEKGEKDRLAVWTESLAKHSQREDSGTKETKSWPELLENRLLNNSPHSTLASTLSFSKTDSLKNTTEKDEDKVADESEDHDLNWAGPGLEGAEPGPGQTLPLSPHPGNPPKPPDEGKEAENKSEERKDPGLTSVLDILEGRRPLGDPVSPLGSRGGQDHGGQQGEDSGIESMDTLSEKSPNQGESPFHAVNDPCIEGSRVPTYSSSMGSVSGKVSPPVSDSGSTDSLVTSTPPDKSPAPPPPANLHTQQENSETKPDTRTDSQTSPDSISLQRSEFIPSSDTQTEKPGSPNPSSETFPNSPKPSDICDSKPVETNTENSKVTNHPLDQEHSSQSSALTPRRSSLTSSVENISNSQSDNVSLDLPIQNGDTEMEEKDSDLIRSCDGADDKCPGDLVEIPRPDNSKSEHPRSMHDYANVKTVNHVSKSFSNNSNSDCNIITVRNGDRSPPPSSLPSSSSVEIKTVERSLDQVSEQAPGLINPSKVLDPVNRPSYPLPVSSVSITTLGPAGMSVRTQLPLRPGAKMVPVKLVSVSGAGGRMVRVSPVKGGEIVGTTVGTSGLPARTVVIKSSLLKSFSEQSSDGALTTCLVRLAGPAPASTTSLVSYPALPPSSICDNTLSGEPSQPSVNPSGHSSSSQHSSSSSSPLPPSTETPLEPIDSTVVSETSLNASSTPAKSSSTPSAGLETPTTSSDTPTSSSDTPINSETVSAAGDPVKQTNGSTSSSPQPSDKDESPTDKVSVNSGVLATPEETQPMPSPQPKSKTQVDLTNGEISEGSDLKSKRSRNGKRSSEEESEGSLLRPLIAKDDVECSSPLLAPESPASGKRSRRDTGSSVQSDKSDLSILSSQSLEPAAKRLKEEVKSRRGSTSPGIREMNRTLDKKKVEDKGIEGQTENKMDTGNVKKNNSLENKKEILSNGSKSLKPKPELKKVGRPTGVKEKVSSKTDAKVGGAKPSGTNLVPDLGRRVSARVKKPDEATPVNDKKKKR